MITVRHRAALLSTMALFATAAVTAVATPAGAEVQGFDVKMTDVPRTFSAGAGPVTVTAVASTSVGRVCQKVRWSMVMQVDGVDFDQVRVQRVEESGSFPLQVQADGDTARLTDTRLDPGALCVGRTVTARYQVSFDDDATNGEVRFQAEVFDVRQRLLEKGSATSQVVNGDAAKPAPTKEAEPSPEPSATASPDGDAGARDSEVDQPQDRDEEPAVSPTDTSIAAVPAGNGGSTNLLGVGLIIGALLIFMGVGLLLRMRTRTRAEEPAMALTRSFDPSP
jgi:hypothetical protein